MNPKKIADQFDFVRTYIVDPQLVAKGKENASMQERNDMAIAELRSLKKQFDAERKTRPNDFKEEPKEGSGSWFYVWADKETKRKAKDLIK